MADAGQMLAQLWGNNPLDAYFKGVQAKVALAGVNNQIAAQTFQNNLNAVKIADEQSQNFFNNQLKDRELAVHTQNAITQRMFAEHQLDPAKLQLDQLLQQAKITSLLGKNQTAQPWTPGALVGSPSEQGGSPVGLPINPGDTGATVSATGAPGVLPANDGQGVPVTPQIAAAVNNDPQVSQMTQQAKAQGLQMTLAHQQTYGRSPQDTLAFDMSADQSDNTPSDAEIESANGVQDYVAKLGASAPGPSPAAQRALQAAQNNPLLQENQTTGQAAAPVSVMHSVTTTPTPTQFAAIQPTKGIVVDPGGVTGHSIVQREDGVLMYQQFKQDPKTGKPVALGEAKELKSKPQSVIPPEEQDGMERYAMHQDAKGNWSATYKNKKGDSEITYEPSYNADGSLHGTVVKKDGKAWRFEVPKPPATLKMMSKDAAAQLGEYGKNANLNPDDQATKETAYKEKYGHGMSTFPSADEWTKAYEAAVEKREKAKKDLQYLVPELQQGHYVIPPSLQPFVNQAVAAPPSTAAPSSATSSVPDPLKKYYGQ